jgi:ligand-binding SRPBCC domain-containing protein
LKEYRLEREQWVASDPGRVFEFFSDARNLADLTPSWLGFRIRTPLPVELRKDVQLDYRIRLAGVPLRWRTRITDWEPPSGFVDVQERGPFAFWEHTHRFRPLGDGVLVTDVVRYALPLGPLGRAVHALAVRAALASFFDQRRDSIRAWLG